MGPGAPSTNTVASFGGKTLAQSPTGTHARSPKASRVAPVHGCAGKMARHAHPSEARSKPCAHAVGPTGVHVARPGSGASPAGQFAGGSASGVAHVPEAAQSSAGAAGGVDDAASSPHATSAKRKNQALRTAIRSRVLASGRQDARRASRGGAQGMAIATKSCSIRFMRARARVSASGSDSPSRTGSRTSK